MIIFHADDYAANPEVSRNIIDCIKCGVVTSISVLPNSKYLEECMKMLAPYRSSVRLNMHLNLAEGPCLSDAEKIPLLVDKRGMLHNSYGKILLLSISPERRELKRQIKTEFRAQICTLLKYTDALRIDSHQHYHMIPLVLDSILECIDEIPECGGRESIEFIRIPAEPLTPYLQHPQLWGTYRPINLVKNLTLQFLGLLDSRMLAPYKKNKTALFFGIVLSCEMDETRVRKLLPRFKKIADRIGRPLEVTAHPGGMKTEQGLMDPENELCKSFFLSPRRMDEKKMFLSMATTPVR